MNEECEHGTTGENCSVPCAPGYFGRQCNERCHCPSEKYCDPTKGCLCNSTSVYCTDQGRVIKHKQRAIKMKFWFCVVCLFFGCGFFNFDFIYFLYESLEETSINILCESFQQIVIFASTEPAVTETMTKQQFLSPITVSNTRIETYFIF